MKMRQETFPKLSQLWRGATLRTIAHAISLAHDPTLSYEVFWENLNYTRQDSAGSRGAITFAENYAVGAFFDEHSSRNPFRSANPGGYDLASFFVGIPVEQLSRLQEETLQYLVEEYGGELKPVITSAFWSEEESLSAAEPWDEVYRHGAHLIRIEIMDEEAALAALQSEYEFPASQMTLLHSLFTRRVTGFDNHLILDQSEYATLTFNGIIGLDESKRLLETINIKCP